MYFLFHRDIELACDESVVRQLGDEAKSPYSRMLIDLEAAKSGFLPFCSGFSENAMEERITAIMKTKKNSLFAIFFAAALVAGVTAVFATSAAGAGEKDAVRGTDFTDEEIEKLLDLRFEGYEDLRVSEFQNRAWELTDTEEYRDLLERFSQNTALYEQRDQNAAASFYFYTLEPLTAERWRTRDFAGGVTAGDPGVSDQATLEYVFSLTILNADALTVGEYDAARLGVENGLQTALQGKTEEQLRNEAWMQEALRAGIEELAAQWSSDRLRVSVEYAYTPLSEWDGGGSGEGSVRQERESRLYPAGTREDYRSLLALKTPDYRERSVADFNLELLEWANEDYERMERINGDIGEGNFSVDLSGGERSFVTLTARLSGAENGKYVQSNYTGRKEEDPCFNQTLPSKTAEENGQGAWCELFYQFSYHIPDKKTLTVGERDDCVSRMLSEIQDFWNGTDLDEMLSMTEEDVIGKLRETAAAYSGGGITITVREDSVSFEKMDERNTGRE